MWHCMAYQIISSKIAFTHIWLGLDVGKAIETCAIEPCAVVLNVQHMHNVVMRGRGHEGREHNYGRINIISPSCEPLQQPALSLLCLYAPYFRPPPADISATIKMLATFH